MKCPELKSDNMNEPSENEDEEVKTAHLETNRRKFYRSSPRRNIFLTKCQLS